MERAYFSGRRKPGVVFRVPARRGGVVEEEWRRERREDVLRKEWRGLVGKDICVSFGGGTMSKGETERSEKA